MTSKIVLPAVVIMLALTFASGKKIKCYECIAVGAANDKCDGDIMVKSNDPKPIECSTSTLYAWHDNIKNHPPLNKISEIFKVDPVSPQNDLDVPMACIKINLRVDNQPAILRTCQTAKTEQVDTCKAITTKISQRFAQSAQVQNCTLCDTDSCNSSYSLSPTMIVALLPLLGSLLMSLVHSSA